MQSDQLGAGVLPSHRALASLCAGGLEIICFHPFDTSAKRLMSNKGTVYTHSAFETLHNIKSVILAPSVSSIDTVARPAKVGLIRSVSSLYQGVLFSGAYRVQQRLFHFLVQPSLASSVSSHYGSYFNRKFDTKTGNAIIHGLSGAAVGASEAILAPFDRLKIIKQTNPEAFHNRNILTIFREENIRSFYRGASWTIYRNAPTAFCLFGGISYVKSKLFNNHIDIHQFGPVYQNFMASAIAGGATMVLGNPLDVIKTRVQRQNFGAAKTGADIIKDLIQNERVFALYKGLPVKLIVIVPRLVFSYTIASHLTQYFAK